MDILIKNMEMPVDCRYCRFYRKQKDGIHYCHAQRMAISGGIEVLDKIKKGCPLAELPEHKKAYWKNAMCSNCGAVRLVSASGNFYYVNYCHNCGAEIVEANNGADN